MGASSRTSPAVFRAVLLGADEFRAAVSNASARVYNCHSSASLKPFQNLSLVPCESANVSSMSRFSASGVFDLPG